MSEATPEATPEAVEPAETSKSVPPWGDDFSPEIAWERLQKVQRENKDLRQRPVLTPEQQQQLDEYNRLAEASKSEQQRQAEALEAANRAREAAQAEALRYRVAAEHGIGKDDLDLLGSGTEEELVARAQRIADLRSAGASQAAPAPVPGQQRPVEQLRPGATPTSGVKTEDDLNYERLFGSGTR